MPSRRPEETIIFPIVVDSPPGTMIPARPSRSSTARTSIGSAPRVRSISACSLKSPCRARTPIFFGSSSSRATPFVSPLPATGREPLRFGKVPHLPADHGHAEPSARLGHGLRVLEVGRRGHDGPGPAGLVPALEDAAPHEHAVGTELHHQRRVGRGGYAAGREQHDGEPAVLGDPSHELVRGPEVLRLRHQLLVLEGAEPAYAADYGAHVPHGLDHVAGACLALGPDHGRTLTDAPQRFAEVRGTTHERHLEGGLVDVVLLVGRGEYLGFVDVVDFKGFQDLGLHEVADARLRHNGDGDRLLDLHDLLRVAHPRDPAVGPYVRGHTLEGHDGHGPRLLGDPGLLGVDDVHDDPALEHLGHPALDPEGPCQLSILDHIISRWYLLEFVRDILLPAPLMAKPGRRTRTTLQFFSLVHILFGELLDERLYAVARGPLRRRQGQGHFLPGKLPYPLQQLPSSHHPLLEPVNGLPYSISMRSLLVGPVDFCDFSGLTSSPTPFSASKPALRKCAAARTRRSPGTRT